MINPSDLESAGSGPSYGAIKLAIATLIGLWLPWIGFAYWYVEVGGFHSGIFVSGTMEFLGFMLATWVVTPLFTLIYIVYARRSVLRNAYDQAMFIIESLVLVGMWAFIGMPFIGH
ncbi:hypothetical protein [Burkholderia sp. MSMB1589WGS]|uniref:hypothetical protein n=1 Tax=Burkholderia sp. MSMB1589WGS TaxID=1636425 RepID=UPI0012E89192|nr:hypothetical protein [Burkholderia sp. MSMB1589WGS]